MFRPSGDVEVRVVVGLENKGLRKPDPQKERLRKGYHKWGCSLLILRVLNRDYSS